MTIEHYPAADFEPALSAVASWLYPGGDIRSKFTMGNGASELIDLITRQAPKGPFKPGPSIIDNTPVQYMEYQRSAEADGRTVIHSNDPQPEAISAIVNPCNPTGMFLNIEELKNHISTKIANNSYVLVDESMLPWHGENWREQSLSSIPTWIENLYKERGIAVWVIFSWTKIWCCPGIRLGSVIAPTTQHMIELKKKQVPWTLNTMAIVFAAEVVKDKEYMHQTWKVTTEWRNATVSRLSNEFPNWKFHGEPWLSWIWIDTGSEETAAKVDELTSNAGMPIRPGSKGYKMPRFIRIGVRNPSEVDNLIKSLQPLKSQLNNTK